MATTLIQQSAKALIEIHRRIESLYGVVSAEDWNDIEIPIYTIYKDRRRKNLYIGKACVVTPIAFRLRAYAKEFY